jgi:hypothetical protein
MALKTYISVEGNKVLYSNGGKPLVKFKYHQAVFDDTLFAVVTPTSADLQRPHTKIDGTREAFGTATADELAEMAGRGVLATASGTGDKFRFFESAIVSAGATTVVATAGITYLVTAGTVTYAGTTYKAGQTFISDGTTTTTSGTGKLRIWFPATLIDEAAQYTEEAFKLAHLGQPGDALSYWQYDEYGFEPQPAGYIA